MYKCTQNEKKKTFFVSLIVFFKGPRYHFFHFQFKLICQTFVDSPVMTIDLGQPVRKSYKSVVQASKFNKLLYQ